MPVNSTHPTFAKYLGQWQMCRDVIEGSREVKRKSIVYLPKLADQTEEEYNAYKSRAMFFPVGHRTVKGLAGAVLRKPYNIEIDDSLKEELDDITEKNEPLNLLLKEALEEVIGIGRVGLFVDSAPADENSDGEIEPYITVYFAENILNWRMTKIEGREQLSLVVLKETGEKIDEKDEFNTIPVERCRVLRLDMNSDSPTYRVEVWEKDDSINPKTAKMEKDKWIKISDVTPTVVGGKPLDHIPFVFIGPTNTNADVEKSPIEDLCEMNISHYRSSADLEHGLHFCALPQAFVKGFDPGAELRIGSAKAWVTDNSQADAKYVEFNGAGLSMIKDNMLDKEKRMAVLGSRLLEERSPDAEAAQTVQLRQDGEKSILSHIALAVSEGLTIALKTWCEWMGKDSEKVKLTLNTDFELQTLDPSKLQNLVSAMQAGAISYDVFFYNLQRGEMYPDGWTMEKEKEKLGEGAPMPKPTPEEQQNLPGQQDRGNDVPNFLSPEELQKQKEERAKMKAAEEQQKKQKLLGEAA